MKNTTETSARCRPKTPCAAPMWKPADCDTITGALAAAAVLPSKPSMAAGLRAWRLGVWIPDGICGKKVVEVHQIEHG